jgi:hypothetical protein
MSEQLYTLEEAKQVLRDGWQKGVICPCCTQFVKLYKRPMYATQAYSLIRLYKLCQEDYTYHHITKLMPAQSSGGGDMAKLVYWGLIEEMPKDEETNEKRTSGYWRITRKGTDFVEGSTTVKSHIKIFDGEFYGFMGKEVSIRDVLGKKFDYEELMGV